MCPIGFGSEETNKFRFRSIVFPALCTGTFGYPIKQATSVIVKAVKSYLKDQKVNSVKEIFFSDMRAETAKSFTEALEQEYTEKVKIFDEDIRGSLEQKSCKGKLN